MPETEHGIVYPESTDHTRLWEHFQNLAESVDALFDSIPVIQAGISGQSAPAASSGGVSDVTVTFPKAFASTPRVTGTANSPWWTVTISNVSATAVTFRCRNVGSSSAITTAVHWHAIGT